MLRRVISLIFYLLLAPYALAASPSFDCKTAKTARELATCNDTRLAAADRDLASIWQSATAHLDSTTLAALRKDQQKFLSALNEGFNSSIWGKAGPPPTASMRLQVSELKRDASDPDDDPLMMLEMQLRERIAFLRALVQANSFAGLWKNADAELWIAPGENGSYQVTFGLTSYGLEKYSCHFSGVSTASGETLASSAAHNTDLDDVEGNIRIVRTGQTLTVTQDGPNKSGAPWICPRVPALTGPMFHTGLTADQAYRLTPDN